MKTLFGWKVLLALLVVFLAGIVIGSAGTVRVIQKRQLERMNSDTWAPLTRTWLKKELDLTAEQQEAVEPLVQESVTELISLRDQADKERKAIYGKMLLGISEHLTTPQRDKLRALIQKEKDQSPGKTTGKN